MRSTVYTKDKLHPRIVFEINCDLDLLTACVKDGEVKPADILAAVKRTMTAVNDAALKGQAKAEAEAKEV
jgi:hypothetical protein